MRRLQRFVGIVAQVDLVQLLLANLSGGLWIQLLGCKKQHSYLLQVIPTKNIHSDIYIYMYIHSDIPSGILSSIYSCTFSGKTCWVSRFHQSCPLLLFLLAFYGFFPTFFLAYVSGISSNMISGICICHILCHSIWHMYLAYLLTFFLAFYLSYLRRFSVVEARLGSLSSSGCCSGQVGNTHIK